MRSAIVRAGALCLLATFAAVGLAAGPALAEGGNVTWTVRTASNSLGADRSSFSYSVNAGASSTDAMIVVNRGKDPLTLAIYAADGFTTGAGQLDLSARGAQQRGIGAWAHADSASVTVQPGRAVEVPFTVTVPNNATPGDYVGGVVTSLTRPDQAKGINVERRLGIRVKLRVGGELAPNLAIENLNIEYAGTVNPFAKGAATVTYSIHNTGNAVLSAQQSVSVTGPFGWLRASAAQIAPPPALLPGESWKVSVAVQDMSPAVRLFATTTLTPRITDLSGSTTSLKPIEATTYTSAIPWALVALVVLVIAIIVATRVLMRRNRARRLLREEARLQEAVEQALRDRADQAS